MDTEYVVPKRRWYSLTCLAIVLVGVLLFCIRGYHDERLVLHFRDFKEPYGGARCLLIKCDPYDSAQVHTAWHDAGGVDVEAIPVVPYSSLYPPFSLAALTPLAALPLPLAHDIWEALIAVSFSVAVVLVALLTLEVGPSLLVSTLLAVFAVTSTIFLMLGQMSGVAIPWLVIGLFCVLQQRAAWLGIACLALASLIKPQETGFLVLYLAFANAFSRRVFAWVAVLCVVGALASIVWISSFPAGVDWFAELRANLHGAFLPGQVNSLARGRLGSMELIQLGGLFGAFDDQALFSKVGAAAVSGLLLLAWLIPVWRLRDTPGKHLLAVAAIACLTLLPVYHRQYDSRLLLLVFPAVAYLLAQSQQRTPGYVMLGLVAAAVVMTSHTFLRFLESHLQVDIKQAGGLKTLLLYRPMPLIVLILCLGFLREMYCLMLRERRVARALTTTVDDMSIIA